MECALQEALRAMFERHGRDPETEIEVRILEVDADRFHKVEARLDTFAGWSAVRRTTTADECWPGAARRSAETGPVLNKISLERALLTVDGRPVRLCASKETAGELPLGPPSIVRAKDRRSFVHKGAVSYDLTRTRTYAIGAPLGEAAVAYEIELEWVGGPVVGADAERAAASLAAKVRDVVEMLA